MRIGILEPNDFSDFALQALQGVGEVSCFNGGDVEEFVANKHVLFVRLGYMLDSALLSKAAALKYICSPTTGLNHIDVGWCTSRGIEIISLKNERDFLTTIRATPEHAFGLIVALLRNYKDAFLSTTHTVWNRDALKGTELYEKKVGIIGFGRVGRLVAQYLTAFGSEVLFYDVDTAIDGGDVRRCESLEELLSETSIVVLSASYSDGSDGFLNKTYIDMMKGAFFINIARGELIDEDYLLDKIAQGHFNGVALDVVQNEQMANNVERLRALTQEHNLIVTPHIGGATHESMHKTEDFITRLLVDRMNT